MKLQNKPRSLRQLAAIAALIGVALTGTASALTVKNNKDNNPSDPLIVDSLRYAIANTPAGGTVDFSSSLNGKTIALKAGQLVVNKQLTIKGLGASKLTVSGNNVSRVFFVSGSFALPTVISDVTITKGNAVGTDLSGSGLDSDGGGILNTGFLSLVRVAVTGNKALVGNGGGIFNSGTSSVSDSTISYNSASSSAPGNGDGNGGGIYDVQDMTIARCAIFNNTAQADGGGIQELGSATLINTTVASNTAGGAGGGINDGFGATIKTYNVTVAGNAAATGGGLANVLPVGQSWELRNTIVANNSAASGPDIFLGSVGAPISQGNNLIGKKDGSIPGPIATYAGSDFLGTIGSPLNPKLGPLQNNGGPTVTMALLPGSPAIDNGSNANLLGTMTSDQRGFMVRIINGGISLTVDIGAYEYSTARSLKNEAIADLQPCLTSLDCRTRSRAASAILCIQRSLTPALWLSDTTLGTCGELVFDKEEEAAYQLQKIISYSPDMACVQDALDAVQDLVLADEQLARAAIDAAVAAGGNAAKINSAKSEMVIAQSYLAKQDYKGAIDHYEHAWELAQQAQGIKEDEDACKAIKRLWEHDGDGDDDCN